MKNSKQSITFKVIVGYLLVATIAGFAVWFIYSQVISYTSMTEDSFSSSSKLYLVSEAATRLYEAEGLSRQLIQTGQESDFELYKSQIDTIRLTLRSLREASGDAPLYNEIDSLNYLLSRKTSNLRELLELRNQDEDQSYYAKVLAELQRVDETFENTNYDKRFAALEPHQRRVLVKLLEYSKVENATQVTTRTIDSLVTAVKKVLADFERADRRYRQTIRNKENELLANEINLNSQLRNLLSKIESQEREASLAQVAQSKEIVKNTSQIIAFLGAASFLVIFIFFFLVVRDVSRSQKYRKELEDAKVYAERLLNSREQFMATVTHDLRSPLNTVMGYTDLLEQTPLNSSQNHYLTHLKKSSEYILRLVNDLLDLAKLDAGKMTVEKLAFNPKNLIEDTVEGTVPSEMRVPVETKISAELDRPIITDPFRLKQILINLITNACKFTEKGRISVEAFLEGQNRHKTLIIKVKDTGIGISKDKLEKVFEEFSQEDSSIEKRFGGSGLGLAITKKLTHLLQGDIELISEPGKGSVFTIKIPVLLAKSPPPASSADQKRHSPRKKADTFSVLIVDDEPAQISLLKELVKAQGFEVETGHNGEEALEKMRRHHFDLVLTDIQMPKMDGFELLEAIKKDPKVKKSPVIALSGKTDIAPPEYLKRGFSGSLLKPYSSRELIEIIEEVLEVEFQAKTVKEFDNEDGGDFSLKEINLFAAGDKKALDTILKAFITSTAKNFLALKEAFREENGEVVGEIAHKMLPMFRQMKAVRIVEKLDFLENPGKRERWEMDLKELKREIDQLIEGLKGKITS